MRSMALLLALFLMWPASGIALAKLAPELRDLALVRQVQLAPDQVEKKLRQTAAGKHRAPQFAVGVQLPAGLGSGSWSETAEGLARWRLKLHSLNATSLHVLMREMRLPAGAELWFYDPAGKIVQGPLTHADETADGRISTAAVPGDTAVLELRVPSSQRDQVKLTLDTVFHGYTDIAKASRDSPLGGGTPGACERDVACPEGAIWNHQIRSVVLITFDTPDASFACSGQLLNNTRLDESPLLLTANHCEIDSGNASTAVVYFNFQKPRCGSGEGSIDQALSGVSFRRSVPSADSRLLRLNQQPPAEFNVYYGGWDATGGAVSQGAGIHHPVAAEKSISLFCAPAEKRNGACAAEDRRGNCELEVDGWVVNWTSGVTEGGSSGSALWNQQQRLVGVLSGGASDCNGGVGNGESDVYGRFDAAFAGGLKADLDPDDTGILSLPGKLAGGAVDGDHTLNPLACGVPSTGGGPAPAGAASTGGGSFNAWSLIVCGFLTVLRRTRRRPVGNTPTT